MRSSRRILGVYRMPVNKPFRALSRMKNTTIRNEFIYNFNYN